MASSLLIGLVGRSRRRQPAFLGWHIIYNNPVFHLLPLHLREEDNEQVSRLTGPFVLRSLPAQSIGTVALDQCRRCRAFRWLVCRGARAVARLLQNFDFFDDVDMFQSHFPMNISLRFPGPQPS